MLNFLKTFQLAGLGLAASFALAPMAEAATLGTFTHDYGTGEYDPGGNDVLGAGFVTVSDQSSGRFNDAFDFSSLAYNAIDGFALTLTFVGAGPSCPLALCGLGEIWSVRINGSNSSASNDDLFGGLSDNLSPQVFTLTAANDVGAMDAFTTALATGIFSFWFSEDSVQSDSFRLASAELTVTGTPSAVPLPAGGLLLIGALGGLAALRRKRKAG